jgi:hypothetical protein
MRKCFGIRQVISRDELNFRVIQPGPDNISPDTAKAVNPYFN